MGEPGLVRGGREGWGVLGGRWRRLASARFRRAAAERRARAVSLVSLRARAPPLPLLLPRYLGRAGQMPLTVTSLTSPTGKSSKLSSEADMVGRFEARVLERLVVLVGARGCALRLLLRERACVCVWTEVVIAVSVCV
jgi:hypothetical protein